MSNKSYLPFEVKVNEIQKDSNVTNSLPIQGKNLSLCLCLSSVCAIASSWCVSCVHLGVCLDVCLVVCLGV